MHCLYQKYEMLFYDQKKHKRRCFWRRSFISLFGWLGGLVLLFLLGNIFLLASVLENSDWKRITNRGANYDGAQNVLNIQLSQRKDLFYLDNNEWRLTQHGTYFSDYDGKLRHLMGKNNETYDVGSHDINESQSKIHAREYFNVRCSDVGNITDIEYIASGWTKAVYKGRLRGHTVALKTVSIGGHDMETCRKTGKYDINECFAKCAGKLVKEIAILTSLHHSNVIQVYGYCIPNSFMNYWDVKHSIIMVTELGEPLDIIRLLQMSWEDRLRVALGMADLLFYLAHSPLGSLVMNDFRRQQFILVDGQLKLTDVDDIVIGERSCEKDSDCNEVVFNQTITTFCLSHCCHELNEYRNILSAGRHFVLFLLQHGVPESLRSLVADISDIYVNITGNSRRLLEFTQQLVANFASGSYLTEDRNKYIDYEKLEGVDMPGMFDYHCKFTLSSNACTLSLFDIHEAAKLCSSDDTCKGFVWTNQKTWTGRTIVYFKSNVKQLVKAEDRCVYVKLQPVR